MIGALEANWYLRLRIAYFCRVEYTLKKSLGQHFLKDEKICLSIVDAIPNCERLVEVGPGAGAITKYILQKPALDFKAVELDDEKVAYLETTYPAIKGKIVHESILDCAPPFEETFTVVGNFPYNISSQILFRVLEWKDQVPVMVGMFQKEVALRIAEKEGSKVYGILSVLTQAFYDVEYLFTVPPTVFNPPPKVDSGVIRLVRKENYTLPVNEKLFYKVVKTAFQQRRKTLRNSLKTLNLSDSLREDSIFAKRPEQLSVQEFINLTSKIENDAI